MMPNFCHKPSESQRANGCCVCLIMTQLIFFQETCTLIYVSLAFFEEGGVGGYWNIVGRQEIGL
jgi:hypothetical protein